MSRGTVVASGLSMMRGLDNDETRETYGDELSHEWTIETDDDGRTFVGVASTAVGLYTYSEHADEAAARAWLDASFAYTIEAVND